MKAKITDTEWVELRDQALRAVLENDDLSCELIDSIDDEYALRKLFNLTAGKICEKFEEKIREEGYIDDDE